MIMNEEELIEMVREDWRAIRIIKDPSKEVQMAAGTYLTVKDLIITTCLLVCLLIYLL